MTDAPHILAIDQGTTSSRAIVFDRQGRIIANAQQEFPQIYPKDGWVEHDPEDIWSTVLSVSRDALTQAAAAGKKVVAIGITNQRETTLVWDRETGKPIHNAIVWQDRRTTDQCRALKEAGHEDMIRARTGLVLDPYFSASKIAWILDNVEGARASAEAGHLAYGTIDTFLIWRLTGGKVHATDATNASRTSLLNIVNGTWDNDLLELFSVPASGLAKVLDCADDYGVTANGIFGEPLPILGVAGDQQAATIGQAGFHQGDIKSTYGTGCFVLVNSGDKMIASQHGLLSTIGYRLDKKVSYAVEGSIFIAGAAIQWLRDELGIIQNAAETEALAKSIETNQGVYLVPAFAGLGAPYWQPEARGAMFGLTRGAGRAAFARAALEAVAYQTNDLLSAIKADGISINQLRVDGGMVANAWLLQSMADILDLRIVRPKIRETTALGAAYLAGLKAGLYRDTGEIADLWEEDTAFSPSLGASAREELLQGWKNAVNRTLVRN
ncbi:MAG: glycerol kinase GlpK [Pseudomonadota bacterium]